MALSASEKSEPRPCSLPPLGSALGWRTVLPGCTDQVLQGQGHGQGLGCHPLSRFQRCWRHPGLDDGGEPEQGPQHLDRRERLAAVGLQKPLEGWQAGAPRRDRG